MIDVIITTFNDELTIKKCIESIPLKIFSESVNIIISDDYSTDNTISNAVSALSERSYQIINSNKNTGIGMNRQRALNYSKAEFFLFIDADDKLEEYNFQKRNNIYFKDYDICIFSRNIECRKKQQINFEKSIDLLVSSGKNDPSSLLEEITKNLIMFTEVWGIVFKKKFLEINNINFLDVRSGEDEVFMQEVLANLSQWYFSKDYTLVKSPNLGISQKINKEIRDGYLKILKKSLNIKVDSKNKKNLFLQNYLSYTTNEIIKLLSIQHFYSFCSSLKCDSKFKNYKKNFDENPLYYRPLKEIQADYRAIVTGKIVNLFYLIEEIISDGNKNMPVIIWFASTLTYSIIESLAVLAKINIKFILDDSREGFYNCKSTKKQIPILKAEDFCYINKFDKAKVVIVTSSITLERQIYKRTSNLMPQFEVILHIF